jgi:hypothetical protein
MAGPGVLRPPDRHLKTGREVLGHRVDAGNAWMQSEQLRDDLMDVLLGADALWEGPREKAASAGAGKAG